VIASSSQVHVKQKGKGERGRVRVEGFVSEGQYAGRYKVLASLTLTSNRILSEPSLTLYAQTQVSYLSDGSTCHVNPNRMYKVYGGKSVVICFSTQEYRILAQSQPSPEDFVMDIGCSYGHATALLAQKSADALGVDISVEVRYLGASAWCFLRRSYPRCG
jgi:SAM-dependent methyltransferase